MRSVRYGVGSYDPTVLDVSAPTREARIAAELSRLERARVTLILEVLEPMAGGGRILDAGLPFDSATALRRRFGGAVDDGPAATPTVAEVIAVRAERLGMVRSYLDTVTEADLQTAREPGTPGVPPPGPRTALSCLQVIFNEEWAHHQFALRDLAIVEES